MYRATNSPTIAEAERINPKWWDAIENRGADGQTWTGYDVDGYDTSGYDANGRDRMGFSRQEYERVDAPDLIDAVRAVWGFDGVRPINLTTI